MQTPFLPLNIDTNPWTDWKFSLFAALVPGSTNRKRHKWICHVRHFLLKKTFWCTANLSIVADIPTKPPSCPPSLQVCVCNNSEWFGGTERTTNCDKHQVCQLSDSKTNQFKEEIFQGWTLTSLQLMPSQKWGKSGNSLQASQRMLVPILSMQLQWLFPQKRVSSLDPHSLPKLLESEESEHSGNFWKQFISSRIDNKIPWLFQDFGSGPKWCVEPCP